MFIDTCFHFNFNIEVDNHIKMHHNRDYNAFLNDYYVSFTTKNT